MTTRPLIPDVLADRYASTPMLNIWGPEAKIIAERRFWIAMMRSQSKLGLNIPAAAIADYERVVEQVDVASIRRREIRLRHDEMARIEEFNELAGHQFIHRGMTSRDAGDNLEQSQIHRSMHLTASKTASVLYRLDRRAQEFKTLPMAGRSHNVTAQVITLGKRFSNVAEDLSTGFQRLEEMLDNYPLRGLKGPTGTQQDMLDLLGSQEAVQEIETALMDHLGFDDVLTSVGQVYPRTLDLQVLAPLVSIAASASSFAMTFRLMAGLELVTEGFKPGQVGSTAMPHKMNARSCERICGFYHILRGYLAMIEGPAGSQWNEGDVSCSVVRRVALPGAFMAIDGLLETWLTVLIELGAYPAVINREMERYLPFLTTTTLLMAATKAGAGREMAHAVIKEHAVGVALAMRQSGLSDNPLYERLATDERFPLDLPTIEAVVGDPSKFVGRSVEQVDEMSGRIATLLLPYPDAPNYIPEEIL